MKFALALVAVLAVAGSCTAFEIPNVGKGELAKEIQDFIDLMPVEEMTMLTLEYYAEDAEFQQVVAYLKSEEFQNLAMDVEALPEIVNLMNYIHDAGVDIYYLVNGLNRFIGIPELESPKSMKHSQIVGGVRGYIDEMTALLPIEKIEALYEEKMKNSKVFSDFIAQLESPEFQKIVDTVYANEHFQGLLSKAKEAGIDVIAIKDLLYAILGIKVPTKP